VRKIVGSELGKDFEPNRLEKPVKAEEIVRALMSLSGIALAIFGPGNASVYNPAEEDRVGLPYGPRSAVPAVGGGLQELRGVWR
jgi:hypothetical protein